MPARTSGIRRDAVDHDDAATHVDPFDEMHDADGTREPAAETLRALNGARPAAAVRAANGRAAGSRAANGRMTGHASAPALSIDGTIDDGDHDSTDSSADHDAKDKERMGPDDAFAPLPFNPYKGNRGLTRAWHAMKNSLAGFQVAIREESAFRQELTLAAILIPCGVFVPVDPVARVLLLGTVLLVLIVELLNSSVEAAIDRISLERHELSRRAKDLGSAAVMVALGLCLMTWVVIVGPLVWRWIGMLFR